MKYYLYRHIRLDINEVFYIGIGTKYDRKFYYNHKSEFGRAYSRSNRNKYWKNITNISEYEIEIVLESDNYEFIKEKEIEFITIYGRKDTQLGTLVNVTDGGDGIIGLIFSKEHKEKLSKAKLGKSTWNKGKKMSNEIRKIISESHKGISNKNKDKSYDQLYGLEKSKQIRELQSNSRKGKYKGSDNSFYGKQHSEETKVKMGTSVIQYSLKGEYIETYYSITEAAVQTNSIASLISKVCKGERNKHNDFIWKYENIDNSRICI